MASFEIRSNENDTPTFVADHPFLAAIQYSANVHQNSSATTFNDNKLDNKPTKSTNDEPATILFVARIVNPTI